MIFQYKTTTLKHNRTWTATPSPNGLGGHIKVGQETPEGCSKVRNDFMDSYIIVDVRTKLKKSLYRLSWKIVGWQHCFVNFGCGTDNIFFYKSVKFQINIFTSPEASSVSFFGIFLVNICKTFNNRTKWAG